MAKSISLRINGRTVRMVQPGHVTVAAVLARAGVDHLHRSVELAPRAPVCGMGSCYECRVTIDGRPYQRACQVLATQGMEVESDA